MFMKDDVESAEKMGTLWPQKLGLGAAGRGGGGK